MRILSVFLAMFLVIGCGREPSAVEKHSPVAAVLPDMPDIEIPVKLPSAKPSVAKPRDDQPKSRPAPKDDEAAVKAKQHAAWLEEVKEELDQGERDANARQRAYHRHLGSLSKPAIDEGTTALRIINARGGIELMTPSIIKAARRIDPSRIQFLEAKEAAKEVPDVARRMDQYGKFTKVVGRSDFALFWRLTDKEIGTLIEALREKEFSKFNKRERLLLLDAGAVKYFKDQVEQTSAVEPTPAEKTRRELAAKLAFEKAEKDRIESRAAHAARDKEIIAAREAALAAAAKAKADQEAIRLARLETIANTVFDSGDLYEDYCTLGKKEFLKRYPAATPLKISGRIRTTNAGFAFEHRAHPSDRKQWTAGRRRMFWLSKGVPGSDGLKTGDRAEVTGPITAGVSQDGVLQISIEATRVRKLPAK